MTHAILCERDRLSKHFWQRARMGLWGGVRDCFSTISTTVHQSLNAVSRVKSGIMLQHAARHGHRLRSQCNRIYYGASTHVPLHAQRLLRFASDLDGVMETTCDRDPIKTAMKKEQVRERERYRRKTRFSGRFTPKKSSYWTP